MSTIYLSMLSREHIDLGEDFLTSGPNIVYHSDMQRFLTSISIVVAVVTIWLAQWLHGIYSGLSYGASKMCDYSFAILMADGTRQWWSHMDPYFHIADLYRQIGLVLIGFVLMKLIERGRVLAIFALIPPCLAGVLWSWAKGIRNLDINDPDTYIDLLRQTTTEAQVILGLIVSLIVVQLISIFVYFKKHRIKKQEGVA